ncbi:hypothetical protein PR048_001246 [Dryococelus australis]|uniref:Uncharacterized protein n=1 Tax=Dryococelus australis TaxID=614101 RepID=A0ABQ9IGY5_9NEOP|nr:hypothetical protein PR048_001246 [Dryococelus australis]
MAPRRLLAWGSAHLPAPPGADRKTWDAALPNTCLVHQTPTKKIIPCGNCISMPTTLQHLRGQQTIDGSRWLRTTYLRVLALSCFPANMTSKTGASQSHQNILASSLNLSETVAGERRSVTPASLAAVGMIPRRGPDGHEPIIPGRGEGEMGLRLRRGAEESRGVGASCSTISFSLPSTGATVAERLASSPPTNTTTTRIQSLAGSPDFLSWESCRKIPLVGGFSRGSPVFLAYSFRHLSILTSITLVGFQDLAVKSSPILFTHSIILLS